MVKSVTAEPYCSGTNFTEAPSSQTTLLRRDDMKLARTADFIVAVPSSSRGSLGWEVHGQVGRPGGHVLLV